MSTTAALATESATLHTGRVESTFGDSIIYVVMDDGESLSFRPSNLMVKKFDGKIFSYGGQSFDELGLRHGTRVEVGQKRDLTKVLIVSNREDSLIKRLFR
ncbi:hypothetical protein J2X57_000068 [Luteibacter sp. 1214]|uniref:hypothetical protein n=1 Tax=Luteibacter sp. 1214 TaxID=2817735 RepID=UPI002859CDEB|nr:hypothetical protein [Luteibacter sp. 1214]MDR6640874.1 hypothetical protein [Luteibacter sp. 1214]